MKRKILTTLAVLSLSAAAGGTFAAPSYAAATSQSTPVAFNGPDGPFCSTLWTWNGVAGESSFDASPGFLPANCIGMLAGTSPSEVALANGDVVVAFQGINGDLWTWEGVPGNVGTAVDHDLGMMPGTSPAIGPGGDGIAFQANTGVLWTWSGSPTTLGVGTSTGLGMAPDTSPSYSTYALTVFGFNDQLRAVAFQGGNHDLWTWDDNGTADTGLGMAPGTSPSITTSTAENTVNVAFQANGGTLWTWTGTPATRGFGANTDLPMNAGTSPSIIPYSDGGGGDVAVAFQADGGLWTWYGVAGGDAIRYFSDGLGNMAAGTSPSITALANGQTAAAFQADTGALWTWTGTPGTIGSAVGGGCANNACAGDGLPMASGTSPSIVAAILPPPASG